MPFEFRLILFLAVALKGVTCNPNILRSQIKECYVCNTVDHYNGMEDCKRSNQKVLSRANYSKEALKGALGYPLCFVIWTEYKKIPRSVDVERGVMGELEGRAEWKADFGLHGCEIKDDKDKKLTVCLCYTNKCNWQSFKALNVRYDRLGHIPKNPCTFNLDFLYFILALVSFLITSVIYCGLIGDKYSKRRQKLKAQGEAIRRQEIINLSQQAINNKASLTHLSRHSIHKPLNYNQ